MHTQAASFCRRRFACHKPHSLLFFSLVGWRLTHQFSGLDLDQVAAADIRRLDGEQLAVADHVHLSRSCHGSF